MSDPAKSTMAWVVRTTKRTAPGSEPQSRKRQRLSTEAKITSPRTPSRLRQQTLTQIQFAPRVPSPLTVDDLEPIERNDGSKAPVSRVPNALRQPSEPRALRAHRRPKKQKSTLTQMDFLAFNRSEVEDRDEVMSSIAPGELIRAGAEVGKENVDPNVMRSRHRSKGRVKSPVPQLKSQLRTKRRKNSQSRVIDDQDWQGRMLMPIFQSGLQPEAWTELSYAEPATRTIEGKSRARDKARLQQQRTKHHSSTKSDRNGDSARGNDKLGPACPQTPKGRPRVIPSSQSPESVSPMKQRSWNKGKCAVSVARTPSPCPTNSSCSPKRKICTLKYGLGRSRSLKTLVDGIRDANEGACASSRYPEFRSVDADVGCNKQPPDDGDPSDNVKALVEPERPMTTHTTRSKVIPSSQTDTEDEEQIPETSQGLLRVQSASLLNGSEENFEMLPSNPSTSVEVKRLLCRADAPRKETVISTIDDSQDECCDGNGLSCLTTIDATRDFEVLIDSVKEVSELIISTKDTQSPKLPQTCCPPLNDSSSSTIKIPTKPPQLSSPSSPRARFSSQSTAICWKTTQTSVQPASMARPSQVSTQAPTQLSWHLMSSMLPSSETATTISQSCYRKSDHVAVKDSSSQAVPFHHIPLQTQTQSQRQDGGCSTTTPFLPRDETHINHDLDPQSSPTQQPLAHPKDSFPPVPTLQPHLHTPTRNPSTLSTSALSDCESESETETEIEPESGNGNKNQHENENESILESLPGPPGWRWVSPRPSASPSPFSPHHNDSIFPLS